MQTYHYQASDTSGKRYKGTIEADNDRHARQLLRARHLIPVRLHVIKQPSMISFRLKCSPQDLAIFTRQLATLLAAGIPLEASLIGVSEQTEKQKIKQFVTGVRTKVSEGYSLAQAMGEYPTIFPELYRATVAAGEQIGRLDLILEKLADYTENQQANRQKIQQALIYPSLMVVVSTFIVGFLMVFVVPKMIEVFLTSNQQLPLMTSALVGASNFLKTYSAYLLIVIILAILSFKQSLKYSRIKQGWHQFILKVPFIAHLIKSVNVARYIHTFSMLFAAGVNILETMRVSAGLIHYVPMHEAFKQASLKVKEGIGIHQALKDTGYLRPMAAHLIASGEQSGTLPAMMERAATHLDIEVKRIIDTLLTILEPVIILIMGGIVLFIVMATLLPIFSMEQLIT